MWHDRNNWLTRLAPGALIPLIAALGCTPDGPEGGIPTHPTDRYSVTLEWDAPTVDAVGRPLEDLAGYRLYYSPDPPADGPYSEMIEIGDTTRVTVDGLAAGDYLFAVTALDVDGNESDFSEPLPVKVGP
jgi:hypothetical protein